VEVRFASRKNKKESRAKVVIQPLNTNQQGEGIIQPLNANQQGEGYHPAFKCESAG
jgi:hypothetical protein